MTSIAEIVIGDPLENPTDNPFFVLLETVKAIDAALPGTNLVPTLLNPGTLTVFAPNNAAFGSLAKNLGFTGDAADAQAVFDFLAGNVPIETLRDVVLYHVLPEVKTAADIASNPTLSTALGLSITADLPTLVDNEPDLIDPSLIATDIPASNGIVHVIDQVLLPIDLPGNDAPTITGIALASGDGFDDNNQDFDLLREAVVAAGLADALNDPNADFTVFAPDDAAFIGLAQALGFKGDDEAGAFGYIVSALRLLSNGEDPIPLLQTILKYHVAPESLQASQVLAADSIPTLAGLDLTLDGTSVVDGDPDLPNPNLIATDIQAANGVVHVLDGVLIPVDVLQSNGANDVDFVIGDDGRDHIRTGRDNDLIDAQGGNDYVSAGSGDDVVLAGDGRDFVRAGSGDDLVKGEGGNDFLRGQSGDDTIDGGEGNDFISGGRGDDVITAGDGHDKLFGGRGDDTFIFTEDNGTNYIFDFDRRGDDQIDLSAYGFENFDEVEDHISGRFFSTKIDLGDTDIVLFGTRAHTLTEDDFIL